ncbi:hypothetical protein NQ317_005451 [Molorchus minor]|uniref:C2H2-type domain-containing protein n=1 Tax=Molorchus minor TaxID=1323400 RepID=A0ABQ9ITC9_9CUCU|nr:hypothetical protein NQ317_005451 [Molorchus minor]
MLHSNIKAFKCSSCSKEYKERRTYEIHLTRVHGIGNAKVPVREKKYLLAKEVGHARKGGADF